MQDTHFTTAFGKASPKLMLACAKGQHLKQAVLTGCKAGKGRQEYLKVELENVLVSSYASRGSQTVPMDSSRSPSARSWSSTCRSAPTAAPAPPRGRGGTSSGTSPCARGYRRVRDGIGRAVRLSAGLLLYRIEDGALRVLLAHMGGPFWAAKDERAWTVPKGEHDAADDPAAAAVREFAEEMGRPAPPGEPVDLGVLKLSGGKRLTVFALEADFDADHIASNLFELEWPPRSGRVQAFPEVDRAAWFDPVTARPKLTAGQAPVLDLLLAELARQGRPVEQGKS